MRGTLFLVVGPSGAGKDSLIDGAKAALGGNEKFVFPKRYVTRPSGAGGEDHIPVTEASFEALLQRGDMLLHWDAHNLRYGVPIAMGECLNNGMNVIVNVSRTVVDLARERFSPVVILYVTVSDDVLAQRLQMRGRETMADIQKRVARAQEYRITGEDVRMIDNGGALDVSITTFLQAIGASAAI
jgi:phosphonate metabolism protein PhnN/1,5-bisphosphokinase (PRPP-forming)